MRFYKSKFSNKHEDVKVFIFGAGREELKLLLDICEKKRSEIVNIFELNPTKNRLNNFSREIRKALKEQ